MKTVTHDGLILSGSLAIGAVVGAGPQVLHHALALCLGAATLFAITTALAARRRRNAEV